MQPKNEHISGFFQQNFKIVFGRIESRLKRGPIFEKCELAMIKTD